MKIVNIMNFVRYIDERHENSIEEQYNTTRDELALVNEFGYENTFLLQYDALCSEDYQRLFREEATDKTEIGLWYEIVRPLTDACGMEYRSERGWSWDWHIVPGFSMAYTPREREILVDEAMRKFREVFGYYPKLDKKGEEFLKFLAFFQQVTHSIASQKLSFRVPRLTCSFFVMLHPPVSLGRRGGKSHASHRAVGGTANDMVLKLDVKLIEISAPPPHAHDEI